MERETEGDSIRNSSEEDESDREERNSDLKLERKKE